MRWALFLGCVAAGMGCGPGACPLPEPGTICSWAGTGEASFDGDDRPIAEAALYWPVSVTFTDDASYVLDWNNHRVRRVTDEGTFETVIGSDFLGDGPPDRSDLERPGAEGTEVLLNHPTQLLPMPDGTLLLMAWHNHKLRSFDPETGLVWVMAGGEPGYLGDGGPAQDALLDQPMQGDVVEDGSVFFVDQRNQVVRRIDPDGRIDTVAGTPRTAGFEGDGGHPLDAVFSFPDGTNPPPGGSVAIDADGYIYVSDTYNHCIRRIDPDLDHIESVVGTGQAGMSGDGGAPNTAQLDTPVGMAFGPDGRLYFADRGNDRIRAVDFAADRIETIAGQGGRGFSGDGGPAVEANLDHPMDVTFDDAGDLYISDTYNNRIRVVRRDW